MIDQSIRSSMTESEEVSLDFEFSSEQPSEVAPPHFRSSYHSKRHMTSSQLICQAECAISCKASSEVSCLRRMDDSDVQPVIVSS